MVVTLNTKIGKCYQQQQLGSAVRSIKKVASYLIKNVRRWMDEMEKERS